MSITKDLRGRKCVNFDSIFVDPYSSITKKEEGEIMDCAQRFFTNNKDRFCLVFVG